MNNKSNRAITHVENILAYCQDILDIQSQYEPSKEAFLKDKGYQYAVSFCIEQIGELAKKLREVGFDQKYPNVEWNDIAGLRNRIAHGYNSVELRLVYDIAVMDIPVLMECCKQILQQEKSLEEKIKKAKDQQTPSQTTSRDSLLDR